MTFSRAVEVSMDVEHEAADPGHPLLAHRADPEVRRRRRYPAHRQVLGGELREGGRALRRGGHAGVHVSPSGT